ncbi:hypothetical protein BD289DRAFT_442996, partial [Coniella lustricola]
MLVVVSTLCSTELLAQTSIIFPFNLGEMLRIRPSLHHAQRTTVAASKKDPRGPGPFAEAKFRAYRRGLLTFLVCRWRAIIWRAPAV